MAAEPDPQQSVTCSDCGQELDEQTRPCPNCGGTRRNVAVQAESVITATSSIGVEVAYGPQRPWHERWHEVRENLTELETFYQPGTGIGPMRRRFKDFFVGCYHVGDGLWEDKATGLTRTEVQKFIYGDDALKICEGMANTAKHHTRSKSNAITARIGGIRTDPDGAVYVWIDWSDAMTSGTEDALDLARRCVAAWAQYLADNGLAAPN